MTNDETNDDSAQRRAFVHSAAQIAAGVAVSTFCCVIGLFLILDLFKARAAWGVAFLIPGGTYLLVFLFLARRRSSGQTS